MSTSVTCKTITINFSNYDIFCPYDEELIQFLKTIKIGSRTYEDIRIFETYYGYEWPDGSRFWGFSTEG